MLLSDHCDLTVSLDFVVNMKHAFIYFKHWPMYKPTPARSIRVSGTGNFRAGVTATSSTSLVKNHNPPEPEKSTSHSTIALSLTSLERIISAGAAQLVL